MCRLGLRHFACKICHAVDEMMPAEKSSAAEGGTIGTKPRLCPLPDSHVTFPASTSVQHVFADHHTSSSNVSLPHRDRISSFDGLLFSSH